MQRLLAAICISLALGLAACSKTPATAESTPSPVVAQQNAAPAAAVDTGSADDAQAAIAAAENEAAAAGVSEMDSEEAESVGPAVTTAQPLALRIADVKPEPASQFKEGVNYIRLVPAQPTSGPADEVEVVEAFWYGCPHCYALDPFLESWRKQGKPSYVKFVRVPAVWNQRMGTHARIYYTAEQLGKLDDLHSEIFNEIHQRGNPLDSAQSAAAFFTGHGVSQDAFQKAFASAAVETNLKRAMTLNELYRIDSVPTIVVNGKFVTDVGRAGGQKQLIMLINELASREHGV